MSSRETPRSTKWPKTDRGPQDRSRINMHEDYEVRYRTKALGVPKEELQKLVDEHGNSAANIKDVLGK